MGERATSIKYVTSFCIANDQTEIDGGKVGNNRVSTMYCHKGLD